MDEIFAKLDREHDSIQKKFNIVETNLDANDWKQYDELMKELEGESRKINAQFG